MNEFIQTEIIDRVCVIRLHRPEKKNALTHVMYQALEQALRAADGDARVRCILLAGSETAFSAGNDIADFLEYPPLTPEAPVMRLLRLLPEIGKPMLAAVCGPAVGIGSTLLLHCDLIVCGEQTTFALPFVNLGICPEGGSTLLLAQRVGAARAAEWLLLGEAFDAPAALAAGLVNRMLPNAQVFSQALDWAKKLAAKPPTALLASRRLLREGHQQAARDAIARESARFSELLQLDEAREAFAAFIEKRKPDFSRFG